LNPLYKLFVMNKAVFLDRDGVINFEHGDYTYDRADFQINDGVIESLKIIVEKGYLLIVITNQVGSLRIYIESGYCLFYHNALGLSAKTLR